MSLRYSIPRGAVKDFRQKRSKISLDIQCKRPIPKMWPDYCCTSSVVIRLIRDGGPNYLSDEVKSLMYTACRKPDMPRFCNNSKGKIGLHKLSNRQTCMNGIEGWLGKDLGNDKICIMLKKNFNFKYEPWRVYYDLSPNASSPNQVRLMTSSPNASLPNDKFAQYIYLLLTLPNLTRPNQPCNLTLRGLWITLWTTFLLQTRSTSS